MNKLENLFIGSSGIAGAEIIQTVELPASPDISEIAKTIVQIVIGIVTLFGLFKKKPKIEG